MQKAANQRTKQKENYRTRVNAWNGFKTIMRKKDRWNYKSKNLSKLSEREENNLKPYGSRKENRIKSCWGLI